MVEIPFFFSPSNMYCFLTLLCCCSYNLTSLSCSPSECKSNYAICRALHHSNIQYVLAKKHAAVIPASSPVVILVVHTQQYYKSRRQHFGENYRSLRTTLLHTFGYTHTFSKSIVYITVGGDCLNEALMKSFFFYDS